MEPKKPMVYFSAADLQMVPFLRTPENFDRSLILNLLFQGDLVVTDAFWFMSEFLMSRLKTDSPHTLITYGTIHGAIRPWFRKDVGGSFQKGLQVIRDQGIIGLLPDADEIAESLDEAIESDPNEYEYGVWPKAETPEKPLVGETYYSVVRQFLQAEEPPIEDKKVIALWERTKEWRTDWVEEARNRTKDQTLRRGELLDVVGRKFGYKAEEPILNASELLSLPMPSSKKRDLRFYTNWITQYYDFNQATRFELIPGFAHSLGYEQLAPYSILPKRGEPKDQDFLEYRGEMPGVRELLSIKPNVLMGIRRDFGGLYFEALDSWSKHPSEETADEVTKKLEGYVGAIRKKYLQHPVGPMAEIHFWFTTWEELRQRRWLSFAIDVASFAAGVAGAGPVLPMIVILANHGWAIARLSTPSEMKESLLGVKPVKIRMLARNRRIIRLSPPHKDNVGNSPTDINLPGREKTGGSDN